VTDAGSTVPRRQLGRYLKQLRDQAGTTLRAAAESLEWSRARMYRIEAGQVSLRSHDVLAMCALYSAPTDLAEVLVGLAKESKSKGWWHAYGAVVPAWFELYVGLEAAADRLREFESNVLPGLLQTQEYAEAVIRTRRGLSESEVAQEVAVRMERTRLLQRVRPMAPVLDVILDEGALRRTVADRAAMQRQLAHLVNMSVRPGVSVRVLPLRVGPHLAVSTGSFVILDFPGLNGREPEPTTVYSENLTGALYLDKPAEVEVYVDVWDELGRLALDQRESDDLIATIIKESDD
jgi:transcriptional regulator with XRE-family HTH domain